MEQCQRCFGSSDCIFSGGYSFQSLLNQLYRIEETIRTEDESQVCITLSKWDYSTDIVSHGYSAACVNLKSGTVVISDSMLRKVTLYSLPNNASFLFPTSRMQGTLETLSRLKVYEDKLAFLRFFATTSYPTRLLAWAPLGLSPFGTQ